MSDQHDELLQDLEATQKELQQSIERSRELVKDAKRQLQELRDGIEADQPSG